MKHPLLKKKGFLATNFLIYLIIVITLVDTQLANYHTSVYVQKELKDSQDEFYLVGIIITTFKEKLLSKEVANFLVNGTEVVVNKNNDEYILNYANLVIEIVTKNQEIMNYRIIKGQ